MGIIPTFYFYVIQAYLNFGVFFVSDTHAPNVQHHFRDIAHQHDAAKLGIWLFLATEILLFGGLFCGYAVFRANHPDLFAWGEQFLDERYGALNTAVDYGNGDYVCATGTKKPCNGLFILHIFMCMWLYGHQVN